MSTTDHRASAEASLERIKADLSAWRDEHPLYARDREMQFEDEAEEARWLDTETPWPPDDDADAVWWSTVTVEQGPIGDALEAGLLKALAALDAENPDPPF